MLIKIEKELFRRLGHVKRMNERRITKHIHKACVGGVVSKRPHRTYNDQIKAVLKKGQVKSILNRRACMKALRI